VLVAPYSYDHRTAARAPDLAHYGLDGFAAGKPTTLYHGTSRLFRRFDLGQSRDELVGRFYGRGIFLTPSKRVASRYADANRNVGFEPLIIADLARKNRNAGWLLKQLFELGPDAWESAMREAGFWNDNPPPGVGTADMVGFEQFLGVDPNTLNDIAGYILGSKTRPLESGSSLDLFSQSTGAPEWLYASLDEVGLNSRVYRPKVYTVVAQADNVLVTSSKSKAKSARSKGYDAVIYYGSDLVDDVPEVAVYEPQAVRITKIEVV
jgi:ADP-Ribosyltransferase in polyvalent proteins